mmetsp:Transcript_125675/g.250801  ORF Transcript_125675/g.250801 Transcript_125675/m.250801 type:complete len:125 (-) Transcript_125675:47-421(-)
MPSRSLMDGDGWIEMQKGALNGRTQRTMVSGGTAHQRNSAARYFVEEGHRVTVVETGRKLNPYLARTDAVVHSVGPNFERDPVLRRIMLEERCGGYVDGVVDFGEQKQLKEQGRSAYYESRRGS